MKKVKIIGWDNVGWSIDRDHKNLEYFLSQIDGVELVDSYFSADYYFFIWHDLVLSPRYFFVRLLKKILKKKVIAWITNDITQTNSFSSRVWPVDLWISPNATISRFLEKHNLAHTNIPFFVSEKTFYQLSLSKTDITEKLGISNALIQNKILIGSFQRDSLGGNLDKPKWQKNPDLLINICKELPAEKYLLVLAGPRRHYLVKRCIEENIPYVFVGDSTVFEKEKDDIFVNNLNEETMNLLYNLVDLYIVTSKSESGPKAVLEASLTKTLICSTRVGLAEDFLHPDLLYSENSFENAIKAFNFLADSSQKEKIEKYTEYNYEKVTAKLNEEKYLSLVKQAMNV